MPSNRAFTLLELIVVITIIGILASIVIVSMSGSTNSATIAKGKAYAQQVHALLGSNAVGVWNFDEGTNNTCSATQDVCDISSYGNHGTFYGDTHFVDSDIEGYALSFDGTGDYVDCENNDSFNIIDKITIEVWIKGYGTIVNKGGEPETYSMGIRSNKPVFYRELQGGTNEYLTGATILDINIWHHIVAMDDDTTMKIYVDGNKDLNELSSSGWSAGIDSSSLLIGHIGASGSEILACGYFSGIIDNVRIYSTALPAAEIQKHYVQGLEKLLANQAITQAEYDQRMEEFNQSLVLYEE